VTGAIIVTSSTPLWYATRATGIVALVLLTISMALGLLSSVRYQRPEWPRFVTLALHRNVALVALGFTAIHVLTTVLDSFVSIPLADAFIPFISSYRPIWVGFGAIALDLMIALIITSVLRARMTLRSWRFVHWGAYLCWPVAVLHGLGTGTDTPVRWVLLLTAGCVLAVAGLTLWRLALGWQSRPAAAAVGVAAVVLTLLLGTAWLRIGPLAPGWPTRAGTRTAHVHKSAQDAPARSAAP